MQQLFIHQIFLKKTNLANLKSDVGKLVIDKLKHVPTNLSNFKSKVNKLDFDKLVPVPVDLSELSDIVKNAVVEKDVYNAKIKNIEDKITNLATSTTLNAKINKVQKEVPNITNLATTTTYFAAKYKILGHSALSLPRM